MKKLSNVVVASIIAATMLAGCGSEGEVSDQQQTGANVSVAEDSQSQAASEKSEESSSVESSEESESVIDLTDLVYGTATLTYAEFYAGDVTNTSEYDAVSSATHGKSGIFKNAYTDFVDETTNADGYHILGVNNVSIAVPSSQKDAYAKLNPTFTEVIEQPQQFKLVTVEGDSAVYHETSFHVADTVTTARAELKTSSTWGDYEIDVYDNEGDNAANYLRRDREDEWAINSEIQGIILETEDGLKVGMEYLQSIWVQPYEVSFNVSAESLSNAHIADGGKWDNIPELAKLVGKNVTAITYIMPDNTYVYQFEGIFIKPAFEGNADIKATPAEGTDEFRIENIPSELENPTVTVVMGTGKGRSTLVNKATAEDGIVHMKDTDGNSAVYDPEQTYSVTIGSDNYADIVAAVPMSAGQKKQLEDLIAQAVTALSANEDAALKEHKEEAEALLAAESPTSAESVELINELTSHLSVYKQEESTENSHGSENGSRQNGSGGER